VIGGLLVLCAILHIFTRLYQAHSFWLAFIMTRPFGAHFGDFLTKNHSQGWSGYGGNQWALLHFPLLC